MGKHMGLEKYQNIITRLYKIRSNAIRVSTKNQMCNTNSKRTKEPNSITRELKISSTPLKHLR